MPSWPATLLLGILLLSPGGAATAGERQSHYELARHALETYILPKVEALSTRADGLATAVARFCAVPAEAERPNLRMQFRETLIAWAEAEIVRIGPVTQQGRAQRIAFWPDARGAVARQLRLGLASEDPALAASETIAAQSAAVQGLPALEVLLSDTDTPIGAPGKDGSYRCKVAVAISANVATVAREVADGWTTSGGWRDRLLRPGSDNPAFPSATTGAADVLRSITTSLQIIIEAELKPLAEDGKKLKSFPQPYKRLGLSRDYLLAGIRASRALYEAARLDSYLDPSDPSQTAKSLRSLFEETLASIASDTWMADGRDAAENREQAQKAAATLAAARRLIATDVAKAAEISLGFNELDGD